MPQTGQAYPKDSLQDARRKILKAQYPQVLADYKELKSLQKTADLWGVSKQTILHIVNPNSLKAHKEYIKQVKAWQHYYNKEKHTLAVAKYRARKRAFGLLGTDKRSENPSP